MPRFFVTRRSLVFGALLLVAMVQLATSLVAATQVSNLFRHQLAGETPGEQLALMLVAAITLTAGAEIVRRLLTETLGLSYARSVRLALFERLLRRPVSGGRARSRGSQLLPFVGDLTALRLWWSDGVARGGSSAVVACGIVAWMFTIDTRLGWWMASLSLLALALMAAIAAPYFKATRDQRAIRGTLTALLSDRIGAAHSVMAMGGVQRELNQTARRIDRMNRTSLRRAAWSGTMRGLLAAFPLASVLVLAAASTAIPTHTVAGLLTLSGLLGAALADIGRALELAIPAQIASRRLRVRIEEVSPLGTGEKDEGADRNVLLDLDRLALSSRAPGVSTSLAKGDVVTADGFHAGLLVEVLAGMQTGVRGAVRLSGIPAHALSQRQRRQWLGIAAPWTPLLQDSLADNLLFRMRRGSGAAELPALMGALGLDHLLDEHGKVKVRRLRDEGGDLPPRDKAAIRLVRAMIGKPRLLLLHEATRDCDARQVEALRHLLADWPGVVILAAERPELAGLATRHWSVAGGCITQTIPKQGQPRNGAVVHALHPVREA